MRLVAAVVALVLCVHAGLWFLVRDQSVAPNVEGPLASVSYSPLTHRPESGIRPTPAQIRADLKIISPYTRSIRTYSSTDGGELVPAIANEFGLKVTVGAWLDSTDPKKNL